MSGIEALQPNTDNVIRANDTSRRTETNDNGALISIAEDLAQNTARAAVSTVIERCELFQGLSEEGEANAYIAASIPPPAPDSVQETIVPYELQIRRMVDSSLDSLDPSAWEDDVEFQKTFLATLSEDQHNTARENGLWWRRVCEFRRRDILNRAPVQGEPAVIEAREARARIAFNRREARDDHLRAIRRAEEIIRRSQDDIERAEDTIRAEQRELDAINVEEVRREMENLNPTNALSRSDSNAEPSLPVPAAHEPSPFEEEA
ncbi:hypothetical protein MJO28_017308 [Puccinia striiformis f. sp. tritici]|uniref:Uncharacterized protein n=3 Tax=Puccinia striiformis TaxID=27350 RepID=A0A0L0UZZ7_9BASI|nr:hypothetical protein Pst134EA_004894 [Puccinia striiformis f. sp. tritici]KAH9470984.1 hypothetical protein Pst134EA_004894 [Puccinia striiformis f. sp. tritici]KAI7934074.1 hypothetical protein MJO28_017308 [Puccinia striiformis f. sp. tritici]KNE92612.1 hypothetical protein PSTG_13998 [Puccinia striiformis f. sp. tritici PST-78]POV96595.1 hypothetical protein PSTT_15546 [Puccinia striiformis]